MKLDLPEYCVSGTYEDGSECEELYYDPNDATTRAGYLIENFHCSVTVTDSEGNEYPIFQPFKEENKMKEFNDAYISEKYETGDIVSYDDLVRAIGDGYGDPGNVQIVALDDTKWYPAGFCSIAENGIWDCDEKFVFLKSEYGKNWVGVCGDGWKTAELGLAYLLDL